MRKRNILMALGACLAATLMLAPTVAADPQGGAARLLVGVGSDTTENVMNDFANGRSNPNYTPPNTNVGSWNTLPLNEEVTVKAGTADCTFARPFGSTAGVQRLVDERAAAAADAGRASCVDFARSSSDSRSRFPGSGLTYVPFAFDGLTYVTRNDSTRPSTLTVAQLQAIYLCNVPGYRPLLPQPNSGTRSTWLGFIGVTEADVALRTAAPLTAIQDGNPDPAVQRCLSDTVPVPGDIAGNVPLTESVGSSLDDVRQLVPYSIGQLRAQQAGAIPNVTGIVQGRRVNGIIPNIADPAFPFRRLVYNVIPTQFEGNADYLEVFGPTGRICSNPTVIFVNGFQPISNCGDFSLRSTGPGPVTAAPSAVVDT